MGRPLWGVQWGWARILGFRGRVEAELTETRESAAAAREEAAQLRGQAEALKAQQAQLPEAITVRDGERPKGGKK